jgi:DNA-directed RNA polymerase beta subunit
MRTFSGSDQFQELQKVVLDSYSKLFPVEKNGFRLELGKMWLDDEAVEPGDFTTQKKVKLAGNTWGAPLYASLVLKDADGKIVDHLEKTRLATIPRLTPRGSYIVKGNEYQVANQMIRKPGAYVVKSQKGDQFKGMLALTGDRQQNFEVHFDTTTNKYKAKLGQSFIPLYPLLKSLGASDKEMVSAWGEKIFTANKSERPTDYFKLSEKLARAPRTDNQQTAIEAIQAYAKTAKVDPNITKLTMGHAYENLSHGLLLDTSKKILSSYQGKTEPDDLENLLFKEIRSVEDMLQDRLGSKKEQDGLKRMLTRHLGRKTSIRSLIDFKKLTSPVESFFTSDNRTATSEQYNPIHMIAEQNKLTIHGTGGITSSHAVSQSLREVHPSHIGFIDPVHTPECYDGMTEVFTKSGWKKWTDVTVSDKFACRIENTLEFHEASAFHKSHYKGLMYGFKNNKVDYLVTPNHRMFVQANDPSSEWRIETAEKTHLKNRRLTSAHFPFSGDTSATHFTLERVGGSSSTVNFDRINIEDWCELVGWVLSEGCVVNKKYGSKYSYALKIAQNEKANPEKCARIKALLSRLPWRWCQNTAKTDFIIGVKQLAMQFKEQGYCYEKFIPEYLFEAPVQARERMLEALLLGDGRTFSHRVTGVSYEQKVYTTTSKELAIGVERLAIGLGYGVKTAVYQDNRQEHYRDMFEIRLLSHGDRTLRANYYYTTDFNDTVYCATVPGSLLLVRRNGSVPIWLGNSDKTGTTLHLASAVVKDGRNIRTFVRNVKTDKMELLTPQEIYFKNVAFPDEYVGGKFKNASGVRIQAQGKVDMVPSHKVDYALPHPTALFSHSTNLVPYLKNDQGNRAMMAAKMIGQAIPLVDREAPLVQTAMPDGKSFHEEIGRQFSIQSPHAGKITAVHSDYIMVDKTKIPVYNNFPLNQKTQMHHTALVNVGDEVKKGQLLADSNYTKNGTLAIGKNLTVAYLPYPGYTFEDGIVITESAAKKLSAEQNYRHTFKLEPKRKETGLRRFLSYYPNTMTKDQASHYELDGVIKKGTRVKSGQILITGMNYAAHSPENMTLNRLNKALALPWSDASVKYTGEFEGTVTDVVKRGDQIDVFVKSIEPARESDKLSGVHGNKGVITKIIPDSDAPRTKDGKIPDVFLNPHGIIGRINVGQIYESAAGKIAQKTGKPRIVHNFDSHDTNKQITADLKAHGISDVEEMVTPDGKSLGKVHVGVPYILRLAKTGKTGFSARMPGQGYDVNLQPVKGGEEGAKALDQLTFFSMLSHGAKKNLLDAHVKSENNDEFWHAIEMGKIPPTPQPSFAFNKFIALLKGAGINVDKQGSEFHLAPMMDKDTLKVSKGKISDARFLYGKNNAEIKGGFFDTSITGGLAGKNYGHLELAERMANPVFENAIKALTEIKGPQYEHLVAGRLHVTPDGKLTPTSDAKTKTGGEGVAALLRHIDVDKSLSTYKAQIRKVKTGADTDKLNRKIRYLTALKELNLSPEEAYTRKLVPVVPPIYRPIQEIPGRGRVVAPPNFLYQNLGILTEAHHHPVMKFLGDEEKAQLREETYKATRAVAGLEPVLTRGKDQPIEGFLSQITGSAPKQGFFLNKLITKKQDLVGRGVITNGPDLHMDEIGIPEKMAKSIFRPFTVREFTQSGYKPDVARREIDENTPLARKMLESAMKKRTVLMNRAPSLHKFSIMAFKPKLSSGLAVKVPPLVFKGFNADIDGDAVSLHVPVSEEALRESTKMFPSNNLWKPGTGELMTVPTQEAAIGLYFLSKTDKGRAEINNLIPAKYHVNTQLTSKGAAELYDRIAKDLPHQFPNIVHAMKQLGDKHAYEVGFTASVADLAVDTKARDAIFKHGDQDAAKLRLAHKPGLERDNKIAAIYEKAAQDSYKGIKEQMKNSGSSFYHMIASGARGKDNQLMQMVSAPGIVMDAKDRKVPVPLNKSYAEGITTSDYFMASYGVRKGMMDRSLQTEKPGAANKDIMAVAGDHVVSENDCGTKRGVELPITSPDVYDRFLSHDQHGHKRNEPVTPQLISELGKKHVKTINVRTPLRCLAPKGLCSHCFGIDEHGHLPQIGDNIGAKAGQTMTEPMTQFVMKTFHTGGVSSGAPTSKGFERVSQLLNMPKYVSGQAALSEVSGKVSKISKTPAGGFDIHVGDQIHTARPGVTPSVSVGDSVHKGDKLTDGVIKPQELLRHKGMLAAQNYIVDELKDTYSQQGVPMQRKIFETVIRAATNNTRVVEAPKHSNFIVGDVIPYTSAVHYNETRKVSVPVSHSSGYFLKENVGKLPQFHEVTDKDHSYLREMGHTHDIEVLKDPLIHAPMIKGITHVPALRKDWMAQLGYRYIKEALTEGAAQSWKSNVEGTHPVPAFAFGASMGKKKEHY